MINRFLRNLRVDRIQSAAVALVWIISPFAFTSCFHHFSYLILPCQLTVIGALLLQKLLKNETEMNSGILRLVLIPIGLAIAWTGEISSPLDRIHPGGCRIHKSIEQVILVSND